MRSLAILGSREFATGVASLLLAVALHVTPGSAKADTLRCGQRLVTDGDTLHEVRARCGEPVHSARRVEFRTARVWVGSRALEQTVEVTIDEWTYDFGPHRFMQHLTFEQGKLVAVVSGHRGEGA